MKIISHSDPVVTCNHYSYSVLENYLPRSYIYWVDALGPESGLQSHLYSTVCSCTDSGACAGEEELTLWRKVMSEKN